MNRRITVIAGPPCAGKSTLARDQAQQHDGIVVDLDALAVALGHPHPTTFHCPSAAVDAAHIARASIVKRILSGEITDPAWIIDSLADEPTRFRRYQHAGARLIVLDPGEETCLERAIAADRRPPSVTAEIRRWYARDVATPDRTW